MESNQFFVFPVGNDLHKSSTLAFTMELSQNDHERTKPRMFYYNFLSARFFSFECKQIHLMMTQIYPSIFCRTCSITCIYEDISIVMTVKKIYQMENEGTNYVLIALLTDHAKYEF